MGTSNLPPQYYMDLIDLITLAPDVGTLINPLIHDSIHNQLQPAQVISHIVISMGLIDPSLIKNFCPTLIPCIMDLRAVIPLEELAALLVSYRPDLLPVLHDTAFWEAQCDPVSEAIIHHFSRAYQALES